MSLDTNTNVEEMQAVQTAEGGKAAPANADAQGDFDNLNGDSHATSSTTEEALPSHTVPVGSEVMVVYDAGNAGNVYVGPEGHTEFPLQGQGDHFVSQVNDTAEIYVRTPNSGDSVTLIWEA